MPQLTQEPRPLLKWPGGKRQLLPEFRRFYPEAFATYYEPFLGSAAVFFDLWSRGLLRGRRAVLTDANADLIGCYLRVRDRTEQVLSELERLALGHERGGPTHYLRIRNDAFNPARREWRAAGGEATHYSAELAAMLIYLNRTGYNGLFRVNADGDFNVPPGRYDHPRIVDAVRLRAVAHVLASPAIELATSGFQDVTRRAQAGDFVYFDPPYAPLSTTAHFRSYTARGFGDDDQAALQAIAVALAGKGVHVLLSNSSAPCVKRLYEQNPATREAGLRTYRVPARRAINANATRRGAIDELLVTNLRRNT